MKWFALCSSLMMLVSCTQGKSLGSDSKNRIQIFYNNDNFGYLEPCGCRVSPIGGMDRRWNGMKAYPDGGRVFVDAGNLLFKSTSSTEFLEPQWFEQASGVIEAYNLLGADAVAVGATDFALGVDRFLELSKRANFPFLSANLFWRDKEKLFVKDSLILEKKGKKIGIFGIFHPALPLPAALEARDPILYGKSMVEKLRSQGAEFIIALSHQGYEEDQRFAKAVSGLDLLVGAHSQSLLQSPDLEGSTLLVQLSNQGQMLGLVEYDFSSSPWRRSNFVVRELDAEFKDSPNREANPMKSLVSVTNIRIAEANRKLDEKIWEAHQGQHGGYQTFLSCKNCHGQQASFQEGRRHSAAFLTLLNKKKENNLDCVQCHSVGLGAKGGFRSLADAFLDAQGNAVALGTIKKVWDQPAAEDYRANPSQIRPHVARWMEALKKAGVQKTFVGVQCENCHGPRPDHPFSSGGQSSGKVVAAACLKCHTKEQMPSWYGADGKEKKAVVEAALKSEACPR